MKRFSFLVFFLVLCQSLFSQEFYSDSLFVAPNEKKPISKGLYLGISMAYTIVDNHDAIDLGCRVAWVYDKKIAAGLSGNFFMNGYRTNPQLGSADTYLYNTEGATLSLFVEPIWFCRNKIHLATPIFIGAGTVSYMSNYYDYQDDQWHLLSLGDANFLMLQPALELEVEMSDNFRLSLFAAYRLTSKVSIQRENLSNETISILTQRDLQSVSLGFTFKIGVFDTNKNPNPNHLFTRQNKSRYRTQ